MRDAANVGIVTAQLTLTRAQAYALAQLCKRIGWSDCRQLAVDDDECRTMIRVTDQVRSALEHAGVYVR